MKKCSRPNSQLAIIPIEVPASDNHFLIESHEQFTSGGPQRRNDDQGVIGGDHPLPRSFFYTDGKPNPADFGVSNCGDEPFFVLIVK